MLDAIEGEIRKGKAHLYWVTVGKYLQQNYKIAVSNGIWGVGPEHRHRLATVHEGDFVIFYSNIEGYSLCKILSDPFEDDTPIWPDAAYPFRVHLSAPLLTAPCRNLHEILLDRQGVPYKTPKAFAFGIRGANGVFRKLRSPEIKGIFRELEWIPERHDKALRRNLESRDRQVAELTVEVEGLRVLLEEQSGRTADTQRALEARLRESERRTHLLEEENEALREESKRIRSIGDEATDPTLRERLSEIQTTHLDTVIREAGVVLEHRLRTAGGSGSREHGAKLVDETFHPERARIRFSEDPGEQEGVRMLYRGAMQFIRNPPMHRLMDYQDRTARLYIRMIDSLLCLLSEGEKTTGP
ncbi:TIGR02391 family protein [Chloroflexota bacterium]